MDADIIVTKLNESYLNVRCEKDIARELRDYFTLWIPGHEFSSEFRNHHWDGKIKLFNARSHTINVGLFKYLELFAEDFGYKMIYDSTINQIDYFTEELANPFINKLNLWAKGKPINTRDYQTKTFIHVLQYRRALILCPAASGKSLIIYLIIRHMLDKDYKGLVIVPRTSLVEQIYSDFQDYSSHDNFNVENYLHRIYEGMDKFTKKSLIISTWQSLYTMPPEYFWQFDYVIGDEAHEFVAKSLTYIMNSCINARYRIGLTGSLDDTKTHKLVLEGLFGPLKQMTTTNKLIEQGHLSKLEIKCILLKHPDEVCLKIKQEKDYRGEFEYLVENENRNRFIKNLALSLENNTLILYRLVKKHGMILYENILNSGKLGNKKVYFICGDTAVEDRETIRKLMEESNENIIIASYGTFSTGMRYTEPP